MTNANSTLTAKSTANTLADKEIWKQSGTHGPVGYTVRLTYNSKTKKFFISGEATERGNRHIINPFEISGNKDYYVKTNTGYDFCLRVENWNLTESRISFDAKSWVRVVVWLGGPSIRVIAPLKVLATLEELVSYLKNTGQAYEQIPAA